MHGFANNPVLHQVVVFREMKRVYVFPLGYECCTESFCLASGRCMRDTDSIRQCCYQMVSLLGQGSRWPPMGGAKQRQDE